MECNESTLKLRELILNTRKPIILHSFVDNWRSGGETLEDWCKLYDESQNDIATDFERMPSYSDTGNPQWERERKHIKMTATQFLKEHCQKEQNYWTALNYQLPNEIPAQCKKGIDFTCFGFPHLTDDYARFWLTSPSANTPCHQDTYGCNIVAQVFGSKSWLLFPPNTPLTTTRVPYEESSIYCRENFYAPNEAQLLDLMRFQEHAYHCNLIAGDVLIVPRHWWHFVEAKTNSLSINAWVPLVNDIKAQLEECLVKYLIETFTKQEDAAVKKYILNPNQEELCDETFTLNLLAFLSTKVQASAHDMNPKSAEKRYDYQYLDEEKTEALIKTIPNATYVKQLDSMEYKTLITHNSKRFAKQTEKATYPAPLNIIKEALINSICSGTVVQQILQEFQRRYEENEEQ